MGGGLSSGKGAVLPPEMGGLWASSPWALEARGMEAVLPRRMLGLDDGEDDGNHTWFVVDLNGNVSIAPGECFVDYSSRMEAQAAGEMKTIRWRSEL